MSKMSGIQKKIGSERVSRQLDSRLKMLDPLYKRNRSVNQDEKLLDKFADGKGDDMPHSDY